MPSVERVFPALRARIDALRDGAEVTVFFSLETEFSLLSSGVFPG